MTIGNVKLAVFLAVFLLLPTLVRGADEVRPREGNIEVHDFRFQDGQRLAILRLHYSELGTPKRNASGNIINAVVLLHSTAQSGKSFLAPALANNLFERNQPLDAHQLYIILPDGIGVGGSTKPSDGLRAKFPHYGYIDQVEAQHAMLIAMGIDHVKLVAGISQGGMQTWIWGERYPNYMDVLVPIASMPMQISGRNLIWRQIIIRAIRNDPDWRGGEYDPAHAPTVWMQTAAPLLMMMALNAEKLQAAGPDRAKTLAYFDRLVAQYRGRDANDYLYEIESSSDYYPAPGTGNIKVPLLAIGFLDDEVNPSQFTILKETISRLRNARLVMLPGGDTSYGHASIAHSEIWARSLGDFLAQVPGWRAADK